MKMSDELKPYKTNYNLHYKISHQFAQIEVKVSRYETLYGRENDIEEIAEQNYIDSALLKDRVMLNHVLENISHYDRGDYHDSVTVKKIDTRIEEVTHDTPSLNCTQVTFIENEDKIEAEDVDETFVKVVQ